MAKEKLYIKGIEMAKADEVRKTQAEVANVASDLADYKLEINTSLEDIKEEVKDIIAEGGEAAPIFISSNGATISVENNQANLLEVMNTLLAKIDYATDWFTTNDTQTILDLYPGNLPIIFKLGTNSYKVNRITLQDASINNNYLGITFHLDGSWEKDGQTSAEPYMLSYYEHVEDISFAGFYVDKGEYNNKTLTNIYSNTGLTERLYVSMSGTRYYNPVNYYQTLTTDNDITYEPTGAYNPATKKYVDDKALISAFTYFMESTVDFGTLDLSSGDKTITLTDSEKEQLTEFINRYRQQKSFLHITLKNGMRFLCNSLDDIDLNTTTNIFSLELNSLTNAVYLTVYMEGTRNTDTGHYTVNIARIVLSRNNTTDLQIEELENDVNTAIGDLQDLSTNDKSNLVSAINETYENFTDNYLTKDEVMPAAYLITTGLAVNATSESLSITSLEQFDKAITDAYQKGASSFAIQLQYNAASSTAQSIFACSMVGNVQLQQTYYEGYYYHSNLHCLRRIYIMGSWSNNTFTTSSVKLTTAFDFWNFVSTTPPSSVTSYTLSTPTTFNTAPTLANHSSIISNNQLVDKQYVTDAINNIPGQDLSNYYTKSAVDTKLGTKQDTLIAGDNITITNNIISASGSSDAATLDSTIPVIDMTDGYSDVAIGTGARVLSNTGLELLSALFTTHYQKHGSFDNLVFALKADGVFELFYSSTIVNSASYLYFSRRGFRSTSGNGANGATMLKEFLTQEMFYITMGEADVTVTGINGSGSYAFSSFSNGGTLNDVVLSKTNTNSYTPTSNYHPATKKYVDDTITTRISTKQDTLTAGANITIDANNVISATVSGGSGEIGDSNLQVAEMPEATADTLGTIVEYTGADTEDYKRGYFYRNEVTNTIPLESITTTSTSYNYWTTPLEMKANYKIEMKVKLNTYYSGAHFFSANGSNSYYCLRTYSGYYAYGLNGSTTTSSIPYKTGEDLVLTYNDDEGNITVNDSIIATGIATPNHYSGYKLYLFNQYTQATLYYCKVWNKTTGELLAEYIPVKYNGKDAIYDKVSNQFATWQSYSSSYYTVAEGDGTVNAHYYWTPQHVQDFHSPYTWSNAIDTRQFYEDAQRAIDAYRKNSYDLVNWEIGGLKLAYVGYQTYSSGVYRLYYLYFNRSYNTYNYTRLVQIYTTYDDYIVYERGSRYEPIIGSESSYSFLTSHQSLSNYLSKTNTTAYTPSDNYHPATKKYVDDYVANYDLTGQFLDKENILPYTPEAPYHPCTKQYAESYANQLFQTANNLTFKVVETLPTEEISTSTIYLVGTANPYDMYAYINGAWQSLGTTSIDLEPEEHTFAGEPLIEANNYTVENMSTPYGFILGESGYYTSNCQGVSYGYAVCKVTFNNDIERDIPITYINDAQKSYDFGIFSNLDTTLSLSYSTDSSSSIYHSCASESSELPKTLIYTVPAGEHFIYIKYKKNSGTNSGSDSLQFKIPDNFITGASYTIANLQGNKTYKLNTLGYLTIENASSFGRETTILVRSEENGLYVTMPASITNIGDNPDFATTESGYNMGYCAGNASYIISIMNDIAVWKVYNRVEEE